MLNALNVIESRWGLSIKAGDGEEVAYVNKIGEHGSIGGELRKLAEQMAAAPQLVKARANIIGLAEEAIAQRERGEVLTDADELLLYQSDWAEADLLLSKLRKLDAV